MSYAPKEQIFEAPIKVKASTTEKQFIKEFKLSWAGKIFFAGAAAYILGSAGKKVSLPIKIKGSPQQIRAVIDAIVNSKKFQQELQKPGATIDSVVDRLRIRNLSKTHFYRLTGKPWPI